MATTITNPISSPLAGEAGTEVAYDFEVASGVAPYVWGVTDDSPAWLSISSSGILFGTPPTAGTYTATVQVADSSVPAVIDENTFTLTIAYSAVISGTLRLDTSSGVFAARKVYLYDYATGAKVAEDTSDAVTGAWSFTQVAPGDYFVVGVATSDDEQTYHRDFDAMGVITVT